MTKVELWSEVTDFYWANGWCPQPNEIANKCKLSLGAIYQVYDSWISAGKLLKVKPANTDKFYYRFRAVMNKDDSGETPVNAARIDSDEHKHIEEYKETTKPKTPLNFDVFKGIWLKLLGAIIAGILLICSIHFTYEFNHKSMNILWAMMMSLSICGFTGFAFSIADAIKGKNKWVVIAMWCIGTIYSISTAIGTQYNNFMEFKARDTSSVIETQKEITEKQINQLTRKAETLYVFREQEIEYNENPDLKIENRGTWKLISERVSELNEIENTIIELQNKLITIGETESDNVRNKTIYSWLEDITKISSDVWQFIIMCFPAVFIDLTVSVLIKFVFQKERKDEDKTTKPRNRRK